MKILDTLLLTILLLLSTSAAAHTGLESSLPADGEVMMEAPETIELNFKGVVKLIAVEIKDAKGSLISLDLSSAKESGKQFNLPLPDLEISTYRVNWVSAGADGHKIKGKFVFKYVGADGQADEGISFLEMNGVSVSAWDIGTLLNKILIYIALAMTVGGLAAMFTLFRYDSRQIPFINYLPLGCLLGLIAVTIGFFLQVGSFAEEGISGMWNSDYMHILWDSGAGKSFRWQLFGWCFVLLMLALTWIMPRSNLLFSVLSLIGVFMIAASFSFIGHTAEAPIWVRIALILHVVAAMWWMGSLYPLRCACNVLHIPSLQSLMVGFGQQAMYLVGLLVIAGIGISYHLEGSFSNLLFTGHGNLLLLKLGTVAAILCLAAYHKLLLVPCLTNRPAVAALKRSLTIEMGIGFLILVVTAVMSTATGPAYG